MTGAPTTPVHPNPPGPAAPVVVRTRPPGWWARNWKWAVPAGAGVVVLGAVGFVIGILALILGALKTTEVYRTALAEARSDPAVVAALGLPIEDGFLMSGNMEVNAATGYADIAIPIAGPAGKAVIYVEAEKEAGEWGYFTLLVVVDDGTEVDLTADW